MTLELAAIQHDIVWESPTETMAMVRPLVLDAADAGARCHVFAQGSEFRSRWDDLREDVRR